MSIVRFIASYLRYGRSAVGEPEEIGQTGIWRVTNLFVDLYGCRVGSTVVLLDTGMDPRGKPVDALLAAMKAGRTDVSDVFLTHAHPDHVAAAPLFPDANIHAGAADELRLRGLEGPKRCAERIFRRLFPTPDVRPTGLLSGRCEVPVGEAGERLVALPMPGDTGGAYAFYLRGVLIVGDVMDLRGGRLRFAARYATDDPQQNMRSIAGLPEALMDLPVEFIGTSHGGVTPPGRAMALLADVAELARDATAPGREVGTA